MEAMEDVMLVLQHHKDNGSLKFKLVEAEVLCFNPWYFILKPNNLVLSAIGVETQNFLMQDKWESLESE